MITTAVEASPSPLVLIADDEPTTRLLLRAAMVRENFRVIEAHDGKECLELCEQQHPDIVLMDALMPGIDGFSCCTELRLRPESESPPILIITSLDDPVSIDRIFAVGATDYLAKPIHWALLRQRVLRLQDIVKRRQAEAKIRTSLKEKESLLKEVHHRVKNNLQIINSLLHLQSNSITDQQILDVFKESQNRVYSMALIHEKLCQPDALGKIDLRAYIQGLAEKLLQSYEVSKTDVRLIIQSDNILLATDTAVPCGLIINELVSNSLKYAFPPTGPNHLGDSITIKARKTDQTRFSIRYEDNGIGLPETVDIQNTETLGLQLVTSLTEQLCGSFALCSNGGTCFELTALQSS